MGIFRPRAATKTWDWSTALDQDRQNPNGGRLASAFGRRVQVGRAEVRTQPPDAAPLPAPLNALQSERQRQREAKIAAGMRWRAPIADLVFTDSLGAPLVGTRPGGIARHPLAPPEAPPRGAPAGLRGRPGNREPSARPQLSRPDRLHLRRGGAQLERGCRRSTGAVLESARLRAKRRPGSGAPPTGPQLSPARAGCRARRPRSR
jgi:hypothetical protein